MSTVHGLLFEIVGKEVEFLAYAKAGGKEEWQEIESFGEGEKSVEGWRGILSSVRRDTLDYLESLTEAQLEAPIAFPGDWWEGMYLTSIPMHEAMRSIAAHEWYHTGQLVTYLMLRGELQDD